MCLELSKNKISSYSLLKDNWRTHTSHKITLFNETSVRRGQKWERKSLIQRLTTVRADRCFECNDDAVDVSYCDILTASISQMSWFLGALVNMPRLVLGIPGQSYSQMTPAPSVESQLSMSGDRAHEEIPFACYVAFKDAARAKVPSCGITHKPKYWPQNNDWVYPTTAALKHCPNQLFTGNLIGKIIFLKLIGW